MDLVQVLNNFKFQVDCIVIKTAETKVPCSGSMSNNISTNWFLWVCRKHGCPINLGHNLIGNNHCYTKLQNIHILNLPGLFVPFYYRSICLGTIYGVIMQVCLQICFSTGKSGSKGRY